jgi:hypothetical protein
MTATVVRAGHPVDASGQACRPILTESPAGVAGAAACCCARPVDGLRDRQHRRNGRLTESALINALRWAPGTPAAHRRPRRPDPPHRHRHGTVSLTALGQLRLPAAVRHRHGVAAGDRLLLAADPTRGLLVVHPPAAVDAMLGQFHAAVLSGEAQ